MRSTSLFLAGLMVAIPACGKATCRKPPVADFDLQAEVIEALEGGPVVLRVTLTYQGERPVEMLFAIPEADGCAFSTPKGWDRSIESSVRDGTSNGLPGVYRTIKPGHKISRTVYVHEEFKRIPSGRTSLMLSWWVQVGGSTSSRRSMEGKVEEAELGGRGDFEVTTKVDLDVSRATPERLARVRERMEAELDRPGLTEADRRGAARWIIGTSHGTFIPLALRMIASGDPAYPLCSLINFVYDRAEIPGEAHRQLVELAGDPAWGGAGELFWYWNRHRTALPAQDFRKLLETKDIWRRVLTYVTFPNQCGKEWTDRLLRDLRAAQQPLPEQRFARLLADLDDDDFAVREKATRDLVRHGDRVRKQLQQALQGKPSPEARARIRQALDEIAEGPPRVVRSAVWLLSNVDNTQAKEMLRVLAAGPADAWATREAKEALRRLSEP